MPRYVGRTADRKEASLIVAHRARTQRPSPRKPPPRHPRRQPVRLRLLHLRLARLPHLPRLARQRPLLRLPRAPLLLVAAVAWELCSRTSTRAKA